MYKSGYALEQTPRETVDSLSLEVFNCTSEKHFLQDDPVSCRGLVLNSMVLSSPFLMTPNTIVASTIPWELAAVSTERIARLALTKLVWKVIVTKGRK